MDHSEARTREDAYAAAHMEASPQRSPSLTFHPARDDPAQLRSFLKAVCEKHARQTEARGNSSQIEQRGESAHLGELYRQFAGPLHTGIAVARPLDGGAPTGIVTLPLDSRKRPAVDPNNLPPSAPPKPLPPPPEIPLKVAMPAPAQRGPRRRRRSTNQASLLRAKNIDFHKPDPEEDSPPNETEDERRRRRERINGRRKRAKKMIEIDFLNEQYHILRNENTRLKNENDGFRERISMLRRFSASSNRVPPPQARDPTQDLAVTDAEHREALNKDEAGADAVTVAQQKPSPEQKAEFDPGRQQRPSLLPYALAPSAFVLRHMREDFGIASPSEETKDSFVQPQFVGQERLGNNPILAGAPGLATRPQFGGLFASLQAGTPLPQSSSIISALFQHRQNASTAAQPPAHSQGESLLSFPPEQRQVFQLLRGGGANRPEQLSQQHRQLQQLQLLQQQLQRQQYQHQNQQTQRDNAHDQNAPS